MDVTDVALTALQVVSPVLVAALTWAAAKVASFIRSKVESEYLRGVLVRLDDAVITAVKDLQQTVVAEIKAATADGTTPSTTTSWRSSPSATRSTPSARCSSASGPRASSRSSPSRASRWTTSASSAAAPS